MPRYSERFKRDAVALYGDNEELALLVAAKELGINSTTLIDWNSKYGTGKRIRKQAQAATES